LLALLFTALIAFVICPATVIAEQGVVPHPKGCADNEIYLSSQDWWLTTPGEVGEDGLPGLDFGHLHTELCFPHKATITGEMTLDVTSIMHDNPGDFYQLVVQIWQDGWSPDPLLCGIGSAVVCEEFDPPRTLASCETSGGTLIGETTCRWQDSLTFDTSIFPNDGWQQFRVRGLVDQADGSSMRTSTGLHAYLDHGKPISHVYENPDRIEGRGWYTDANYSETSVKGLTSAPVSGLWAPWLEMTPGSEGIPVTNHRAALDANIHMNNVGTELLDGAGPFEGRHMIDTTTLTNGWHTLFLRASQFEPISGSTNSSINVTFFEVLNQSPPACNLTHLNPVVADSYVRGDTFQDDNFGGDDELIIKSASSDYYTRRAYLRFDLSSFAASSAESALFTAQVNYHQSPGVAVPLKLYAVNSDSWEENNITWRNAPSHGSLLGTVNVTDVGPVSFDITTYVESQLATDKLVSLVLLDDSGTNQMLRIRSRSVENDPPQLAVVPSTGECTTSGPGNNPPTAGFTFNTTNLSVDFTDTSSDTDGNITGWSWDFGDGAVASTQNPSHNYAAAGTYTVSLTATDDGGATDAASQAVTTSDPPDTEAPSTPSVLQVGAVTTSTIDLSWAPSTDNVAVTGYELVRDGASLITVSGTSHTDSGLSANTSYGYQVRAEDASGNQSALTGPVVGTTDGATADVISLIAAVYKASRDEFKVTATSSVQPDVSLELVGFGPMTYKRNSYEFKLRPVGNTVIPPTVEIISSLGASLTVPVEGIEPPQLPGAASNPSPADGASGVDVNASLNWSAGAQAESHDVHFGDTQNPPLVSAGQAGASYDPGQLDTSTTYYWRVDEVNSLGTTAGAEWNFTTGDGTTQESVVITKAEWKSSRSELKVEATSTAAPAAVLQVNGYGEMNFDSRKGKYIFTQRPVSANPGQVTVISSEGGSATATVTNR
jgi:PKD repeat protein